MAKNIQQSVFAPKELPSVPGVAGVQFASTNCGFYKHKKDLMLAFFPSGASVAGVFTRSHMASPPVVKCRENLQNSRACVLLVNSGNSFAMTGKKGEAIINNIVSTIAKTFNINAGEVFISSTGVIGQIPDGTKITNAIPSLMQSLQNADEQNTILAAAQTIMTTDTFAKIQSITAEIDGTPVTITGIAKGSGMIEPNMATMLAYIFTDATIPSAVLQTMVSQYVENSFNAITVDSDTSTSDTLLVFATNQVLHTPIHSETDENVQNFAHALECVMQGLAKQIVQDGEGISKFITVNVSGGESNKSAKIVAKAIANSPLVKTAIAGADPNWGRIAMAVGKTSEIIDLTKFSIKLGNITIYENEEISSHYNEHNAYEYLQGNQVEITVNIGSGAGNATVWTCDLTHGYININTDYRS